MVILFKGTDKSKNYSPQALALCAGLSATKFLKKTLILQITTKYPVENYLLGKRISEQEINDSMYLFEDTGIDSLTRRAGVTAFTNDHFANAVIPAVSSENLFDILEVSKKVEADIEREIIHDPTVIGTIIKSAKRIYDNIFILSNGKAGEVVKQVLPYCDKTVTCVSQGLKEEISAPECENNYFLVTNYDYKSTYSTRMMQRTYGSKNTFIMPYNVEFKDYYTNKNMLQFILHNTNPEKSDYSYHLIEEMSKLTKTLIEDEAVENDEFRFSNRTFDRYIQEPVSLGGENCLVEVTEKKLLKPSKTYVHVNTDEAIAEDEDIEYIDADVENINPKEIKKIKKQEDKAAKKKAKSDAAKAKADAKREKKEKAAQAKRDKKLGNANLERKEA